MATSFRISLGYNGATIGNTEPYMKELLIETMALCNSPDLIAASISALRGRICTSDEIECIETFADREQLACRIVEATSEDEQTYVLLMASGGGNDRTAKEETRRAFCRLIMERMHAKGININIHVS